MFPVFRTIGEGLATARGFVRAYPVFVIAMFVLAAAAAAAKGFVHLPLPGATSQPATVWVMDTVVLLLLAPAWVAVNRFAILKDTGRGWLPLDMRVRRVALTMLGLSVVTLIGVVPMAIALDVLPRIGPRRLVALGAIGVAVLVRVGSWWLNARLAIAPAMAATGTKPQVMDVSFGYTRRNAARILATRLVVYLPLFVVIGLFELAGRYLVTSQTELLAHGIAAVAVTTLLTTATELVDGAVFAHVAVALVKAQRARAAEAARKARDGVDDD